MKIVTILGSPKKNGKTAEVIGNFEKIMLAQGDKVERINVADYGINACLGCFSCMSKLDEPGCVQRDDAMTVFEKMFLADVIVYASPVYCFDVTSQLKVLIDRHFCLLNKPFMSGKRTALVITCLGDAENNADLAKEAFRRCFDGATGGLIKTDMIGQYVVEFSNSPDFSKRADAAATQLADDISKGKKV